VNTCRLLIFIVTYNAERTVNKVLSRIPVELEKHDVEILIIDDASQDNTFEKAIDYQNSGISPFKLTILYNPVNQGYGGNQKIGYAYAIQNDFDVVALLHGDGQYAPEKLPDLLDTMLAHDADAVFGSRFMTTNGARRGGMPLYKYVGNRILSSFQNRILGSELSEFHSGYRLYRIQALREIPFELNTQDFHFDTEIIIQLIRAGKSIREKEIPTYYGDEICYVNGLRYAWNVVGATINARLMDSGLLYQRKFDISREPGSSPYESKVDFDSSHSEAIDLVPEGSRIVDIGCGVGTIGTALRKKGCTVTGIDQVKEVRKGSLDHHYIHDLSTNSLPIALDTATHILLLDVVEHMPDPEEFVLDLRRASGNNHDAEWIVSTGNVAFFVVRFMLFLGAFNYGKRGILDLTHKRLFTFSTIQKLFEERGFQIQEIRGIPAPFPIAMGDTFLSRFLLKSNRALIRLSRGLFSYQILLRLKTLPTVDTLLEDAIDKSDSRRREVS